MISKLTISFQTAGSRLHGRNVDGINATSRECQTFNHKIKWKREGE